MTDNDYKNLDDIFRILKYISKGKLDLEVWPNTSELHDSLLKLIKEHHEYIEHMKHHH